MSLEVQQHKEHLQHAAPITRTSMAVQYIIATTALLWSVERLFYVRYFSGQYLGTV